MTAQPCHADQSYRVGNVRLRHSPTAGGRRLFDIAVAGVVLVLVAPLMLCIFIALLIEGGRPVFFSQLRLGQRGQLFRLYKFRKFDPAERRSGPLTLARDPRLTRVGRFLERSKLDELPQLWNVLRGDMAIVGPRPETPNFSDCYTERDRALFDHRPGIFGPSQALFRNESELYQPGCDPERFYRDVLFPAKARIDLVYYETRTLMRDIAWVMRGLFAIVGVAGLPRSRRRK